MDADEYLAYRPAEEARILDRWKAAMKFAVEHGEKIHGITDSLLSFNRYSRPGIRRDAILGLVAHYTAARGGVAQAVARYFDRLAQEPVNLDSDKANDRYASTHYVVGLEGEILRMIPDGEVAWAVGSLSYLPGIVEALGPEPNRTTISVEMCIDNEGKFTRNTEDGASWLFAWLASKHGLDDHAIYRHHDITGKICPAPYVYAPDAWISFKTSIRRKLAAINAA